MRRRPHFEPDDELDDDPDAPLASDQDTDDMMDVVDCPECGRSIIDQAEQCPHCGSYIVRDDTPPSSNTKRLIAAIVLIAMLLTFAMALLRRS